MAVSGRKYAHLTWATLKAPIHSNPVDTIFLREMEGNRKSIVRKDVSAQTVEPWLKERRIPYTTGKTPGMIGHGADLTQNEAFEFKMTFG